MKPSRFLVVAAVAGVAALAPAASASAARVHGVVVHHNARAHSFVVATRRGALVAVHARRSPAIGRIVALSARRLRNGTFAGRGVRAHGLRRRARIRGTVTWSSAGKREFTVSAAGASLLVHSRDASVPADGQTVVTDVTMDDQGDLDEVDTAQQGEDTNGTELEGVVQAVDTTARTLTVSADDEDQSGSSVLVNVPSGIDMSSFQVGQEVELTVTGPSADGSYTLTQASGDDNETEADHVESEHDSGSGTTTSGGSDN